MWILVEMLKGNSRLKSCGKLEYLVQTIDSNRSSLSSWNEIQKFSGKNFEYFSLWS